MTRCIVEANELLGGETYRLQVGGVGGNESGEFAQIVAAVTPGQFCMLRLAEGDDPLLGRPLGVYRATGKCERPTLEFLYRVVGKMTRRLATQPVGTPLLLWGPLGNGWSLTDVASYEHIICVAGGIGQTPFLPLADFFAEFVAARRAAATPVPRMTLLFGGATRERLVGIDAVRACGVDVQLATDDGSVGHHGRVTDLLVTTLEANRDAVKVLACGPHAMLRAVAEITTARGVACDVSLESPMACGLGLCFGCVVEYRDDDGVWDYKRTCHDGPVFDAYRLRW